MIYQENQYYYRQESKLVSEGSLSVPPPSAKGKCRGSRRQGRRVSTTTTLPPPSSSTTTRTTTMKSSSKMIPSRGGSQHNYPPTQAYRYQYAPPPTPTNLRNIVALDCEMVGVGPDGTQSVLARVSIVDYFGTVVMDTYVKVNEKVTDYRTHVSGIEPQHLESPGAMEFGDCRRLVQRILKNKILVGHGLQNDLRVLGIAHPWCSIRDTADYVYYMDYCSSVGMYRPRRLRTLAKQFLGMLIQQEGSCHDSIEDARAAMGLYQQVKTEWDNYYLMSRRQLVDSHLHMLPFV